MTELYPLLMSPAFDPRPWGTLDLAPIYPNHKFNEKIGEAWLTGDNCVVSNGLLAKRTLADLSKEFGSELVGAAAPDPQRFPLLLKFLFPEESSCMSCDIRGLAASVCTICDSIVYYAYVDSARLNPACNAPPRRGQWSC